MATPRRDDVSKQNIFAWVGLSLLMGATVFVYLSGGFERAVPLPPPIPVSVTLPTGGDVPPLTPEEHSRIQDAFAPYREQVRSANITIDRAPRKGGDANARRLQCLLSIQTTADCELVTRMMRSDRENVVESLVHKIHTAMARYAALDKQGVFTLGQKSYLTDL